MTDIKLKGNFWELSIRHNNLVSPEMKKKLHGIIISMLPHITEPEIKKRNPKNR